MEKAIETILNSLEEGRLNRREAAAKLAGLMAMVMGVGSLGRESRAETVSSLFKVHDVNHVAIRSTDLDRSQAFYEEVLGMQAIAVSPWNRFMRAGTDFRPLRSRLPDR